MAALAALPALEQVETIRKGIATVAFDQIAIAIGVGKETLARKLNINAQTLRKRKSRVLSADEAEKSLRAARVFAMATEILGGNDDARQWLNEEVMALGGKRPLDLLDTDVGAQEVVNLLNCIKWGVYA
ncbi:MAG TPA: antitoxin Xre/MbcA/ParS toxin-binding domain-containing protein [Chthoniobacterales bacterium]|nr:antitoxin Xre/MbcA/ParS toxin-binding domain-containing protein [Chthoniobacterales bacterium]